MPTNATGDLTGTTPLAGQGEETLLNALRQMQALQAQPVLPNDPLTQLGAVLSGFGAGVQGQPNPVLEMYRKQRQDQLTGLGQQATIGGALGTIETQRASRAAQAAQQAETRRYHDVTSGIAQQQADTSKSSAELTRLKTAREMNKDMRDSDDLETRVAGIEGDKKLLNPETGMPLIPANVDSRKMAYMGKRTFFEKKQAELIQMIQHGAKPRSPEFQKLYGNPFPLEYFPQVDQWVETMERLGPDALESAKPKSERDHPTPGILQARRVYLESRDPASLTEDEKRLKAALQATVGRQETNLVTMAQAIQAERAKAGKPPLLADVALQEANDRLDRTKSREDDLDKLARGKGLSGQAALEFKDDLRKEHAKELAEVRAGSQPLPLETASRITTLRYAKGLVGELLTKFTPQERAKYVGYLRFPVSKLKQLIGDQTTPGADPRFADFYVKLMNNQVSTLFVEAGKALTGIESPTMLQVVPYGAEMSVAVFESKLRHAYEKADLIAEGLIELTTSPRSVLKKMQAESVYPKTSGGAPFGYKTLPDGSRQLIIMPLEPRK